MKPRKHLLTTFSVLLVAALLVACGSPAAAPTATPGAHGDAHPTHGDAGSTDACPAYGDAGTPNGHSHRTGGNRGATNANPG